ncbi:MAG: FAD-binding oxidoreductase, partial [Nitratireductor sp.]|nr:FAD-binding oxidoreductase [Nitratireductor sp.]
MNPVEPSPDLIVVGAGIFGLWAARHALKRGERVRVIEKRRVGAGASGGFLGSLMPHMPDRWNAKKQMQYEALYSIGGAIAALEADTGLKCGFRRCGRLLPLKHGRMPAHLAARIEGARAHWVDETGAALFTMEHVAPEELAKRFRGPGGGVWLSPGAAPFGA